MDDETQDKNDNDDALNWCLNNGYVIPKWLQNCNIKCPFVKGNIINGKYGPINYSIAGDPNNPIVLTFHGFNACHTAFSSYQNVLGKNGYHVIAFDMYGHGLSGHPRYKVFGDTFTAKFFVDQADELIDYLGYNGRILSLIGISMGACIAAEYCRYHPDIVDRLIMISPAGLLLKKRKRIKILKCIQCLIPIIPCFISKCCFKRHIKKLDNDELSPIINRLLWTLFITPNSISNLLGVANRIPLWSSRKIFRQVGKLDKLTLFLFGENDNLTPPYLSDEFKLYFTNSHSIIFPNSDHLLSYKMPLQVISTCLSFLGIPSDERIENFKKWLPFNDKGEYIPKVERIITLNRTSSCPDIQEYITHNHTRFKHKFQFFNTEHFKPNKLPTLQLDDDNTQRVPLVLITQFE